MFKDAGETIKKLCEDKKYMGAVPAITNSRIVNSEDNKVFFKHKDYKDNSKIKTMFLEASEFIKRFLMHILPSIFIKIRYYGICANRNKKTKLKLGQKTIEIEGYFINMRIYMLK
jgi:hypothetical protein